MSATSSMGTCLVSGAGGYLGSRLCVALRAKGWRVVEMSRAPKAGTEGLRFTLGEEPAPALFAGATALVHCAYDFRLRSWEEIHRVNVAGSQRLLQRAREAGVSRLVYISSISAYEGCRSLYGKAKLETERAALGAGAAVLRPGLIFGQPPAGMFGRLVEQVSQKKVLPLFGGGGQIQYLIHDQDLAEIIARFVAGQWQSPGQPITVANETPWTFKAILQELARARGKQVRFVPIPWRLLWLALRSAEACHLPLSFRSDSLVSLMYQNPNPSFAPQRQLQFACRAFQP